jgi:hypothetical protein
MHLSIACQFIHFFSSSSTSPQHSYHAPLHVYSSQFIPYSSACFSCTSPSINDFASFHIIPIHALFFSTLITHLFSAGSLCNCILSRLLMHLSHLSSGTSPCYAPLAPFLSMLLIYLFSLFLSCPTPRHGTATKRSITQRLCPLMSLAVM